MKVREKVVCLGSHEISTGEVESETAKKGMLSGPLPPWGTETYPTRELWEVTSHTWVIPSRDEGAGVFIHHILPADFQDLMACCTQWKRGPDAERFKCWLLEMGLAKTKVGSVPENGQATNNTHNVQRQTRLNRLNYMVLEVLKSFENLVIPPALDHLQLYQALYKNTVSRDLG